MRGFSPPSTAAPIDIGPVVRAAQESVRGLGLADAVYASHAPHHPWIRRSSREQVEETARKSPLSSMFESKTYDATGRVVHRSPGLFMGDPTEREQARNAEMARHADLLRNFTVQAQIVPALSALLGEHVLEASDVLDLLRDSALIPQERAGLFAMGIAAGFRRDMVTAMHLLVPQLEHALRVLLRDAGVITTSIDQDGIQSDWSLGRVLSTSEIH